MLKNWYRPHFLLGTLFVLCISISAHALDKFDPEDFVGFWQATDSKYDDVIAVSSNYSTELKGLEFPVTGLNPEHVTSEVTFPVTANNPFKSSFAFVPTGNHMEVAWDEPTGDIKGTGVKKQLSAQASLSSMDEMTIEMVNATDKRSVSITFRRINDGDLGDKLLVQYLAKKARVLLRAYYDTADKSSCTVFQKDSKKKFDLWQLLNYVERQDFVCVRAFFDSGLKYSALNKQSVDLLSKTIENGDLEMLQYLVSKGADVNQNYGSGTPLEVAMKNASGVHWSVLTLPNGKSVLAHLESAAIRYWLVEKGADFNVTNTYSKSPFLVAYDDSSDPTLLKLMLDRGADPTKWDRNTYPKPSDPFISMFYYFNKRWGKNGYALIKQLLDRGANPNAAYDDHSGNVLSVAAPHAPLNVVKLLMERGADRSPRNISWAISRAESRLDDLKKELSDPWNSTRREHNRVLENISDVEAVIAYLKSL